jgi:hypothetical protein
MLLKVSLKGLNDPSLSLEPKVSSESCGKPLVYLPDLELRVRCSSAAMDSSEGAPSRAPAQKERPAPSAGL